MAVNYEDERFNQVNSEKEVALNKVNDVYNNMIDNSDKYYQDQIDAVNEYRDKQTELQQQQGDLAVEKLNIEKERAERDYQKEQRGAYVDYRKELQSAPETIYSQGMKNTGWSETSLRGIYNTYENRVATARQSYNDAVVSYDMAIKEAQLANSSALAEIAYQSLQTSLELALQGFQYKNNLLQTQLEMQNQTEDRYYSRWQDVLNQINTENALEESKRQFNQQMALQRSELNYAYDLNNEEDETIDTYADAQTYGTFSNGYQPKGVGSHGALKETGKTIDVTTQVDSNGNITKTNTQNVWQAEDGTYWYWNGNARRYESFSDGWYNTKNKVTKASQSQANTNLEINLNNTTKPEGILPISITDLSLNAKLNSALMSKLGKIPSKKNIGNTIPVIDYNGNKYYYVYNDYLKNYLWYSDTNSFLNSLPSGEKNVKNSTILEEIMKNYNNGYRF